MKLFKKKEDKFSLEWMNYLINYNTLIRILQEMELEDLDNEYSKLLSKLGTKLKKEREEITRVVSGVTRLKRT